MSQKIMALLLVAILCFLAVSVIAAAPSAPAAVYAIEWWTAAGGGGSSGGVYALSGISGQANTQTSSGGIYTLSGGFWNDSVASPYRAYLPVILK